MSIPAFSQRYCLSATSGSLPKKSGAHAFSLPLFWLPLLGPVLARFTDLASASASYSTGSRGRQEAYSTVFQLPCFFSGYPRSFSAICYYLRCVPFPSWPQLRSRTAADIRGQESLAGPSGPASVPFYVGALRRHGLAEEDAVGNSDGYRLH